MPLIRAGQTKLASADLKVYFARGPLSRVRLRRSLFVYALLFCVGTGLAILAEQPDTQALGLGLVVPGGAFSLFIAGDASQAALHVAYGLASVGLFLVAMFLWFATGNVLAPPCAWGLTAALGAFGREFGLCAEVTAVWSEARYVVPLSVAVLGLVTTGFLWRARALTGRSARGVDLHRPVIVESERMSGRAGDDEDTGELSPEDLARMRFLLDRALQPIGSYHGFEWIDQFQSAAVRYQLNFSGFALSLLQYTHLPAFGGYLTQAQANLIEKQRDPRIWRYWALENFWGNLRAGGKSV